MEQPKILSAGTGVAGLADLTIAAPTADEIRRRFAGQGPCFEFGAGDRGDHELNPGMAPLTDLRKAAVLVPLVDRPTGISVLLTQRTAHLSRHAGQIAFPGGGVEHDDEDDIAAALRETEEEIGLSRTHVEPVGRLDRYVVRTGFAVMPIVGIVHPPFELKLDPHEVADAFEVPLAFILNPANRQRSTVEYQGLTRQFYVFPFPGRHIWGATAGMLVNLVELLTA